jgi:hypothetical protein
MNLLNLEETNQYVNENITEFHNRRIAILSRLSLQQLINKNPYLFRAKNITKAAELIEGAMAAFLSSSEEKLFGDFLEGLAIYVASKTVDGHKSASPGIDLEFINSEIYYIISVKSGSNWGNSSQHKKLAQDFRDAVTRLQQSRLVRRIEPTLGICYGKTKTSYAKDGYLKVVGQNFWTLISNNKDLYTQIIEPIGYRAKDHNDRYYSEQNRITNLLTKQFIDNYCDQTGTINWPRVVEANSGNYDLDKFWN